MPLQFSKELQFSLDGKSALVTGAAGAIGGAVASLLHRSGCRVALADFDYDGAKQTARRLDGQSKNAFAIEYDARDVMAAESAVAQTVAHFAGLDFLIPAAGIYLEKGFVDIGDAEWEQVVDVNLNAVFRISRAAAIAMRPGGAIVHVASVAGHRGSYRHAHYAASKGAILALARSMARDLAPRIRVNTVSPGLIESPMVNDLVRTSGRQMLAETPCDRFGKPEDVAHAVAFLCSDAASFITGESLHVNGGLYMD